MFDGSFTKQPLLPQLHHFARQQVHYPEPGGLEANNLLRRGGRPEPVYHGHRWEKRKENIDT